MMVCLVCLKTQGCVVYGMAWHGCLATVVWERCECDTRMIYMLPSTE